MGQQGTRARRLRRRSHHHQPLARTAARYADTARASKGKVEAINGETDRLLRTARGFRNFNNFRTRILLECCGRVCRSSSACFTCCAISGTPCGTPTSARNPTSTGADSRNATSPV